MNITRNGVLDLTDVKYVEDGTDRRVQFGDVLFNNTNSPALVGKTALITATEPLAFSNHMTRLRFPAHRVDPRFMAHQLQYLWAVGYFKEICSNHVNQASVATKRLGAVEVLLPPLDEQQRIVATLEDHLSRLDVAMGSIESMRRRLSNFRLIAIRDLLLGGTEPAAQHVDLEAAGVDDSVVRPLPEGWKWCRLRDLADVVGGITKDSKRQADPKYVEVPYLRVANVQRGRLDLEQVTTIRVPPEKADALRLESGDVLMNEGGDRDKLGRGWIWEGQIAHCIHQNHVFRARVKNDAIDPLLLSWAANTIGGRWCELNGKQSVNLASISLNRIRLMPIPVPPRALQPTLCIQVQQIDEHVRRLEEATTAALGKAAALRRSLLHSAFSGQLTKELNLV
jgi:type I restriction enzyme S subunit